MSRLGFEGSVHSFDSKPPAGGSEPATYTSVPSDSAASTKELSESRTTSEELKTGKSVTYVPGLICYRCPRLFIADVPMEEPRDRRDDSAGIYFSGTGLISKRPEDIRANTHSAPLAHFAECAVLAGISE